MKTFVENLANLFKVKTLVTIAVIVVFVVLALNGSISPDNVMIIISMVVSFYFGTQHEKSGAAAVSTYTETVEDLPEQEEYTADTVDDGFYQKIHPDESR